MVNQVQILNKVMDAGSNISPQDLESLIQICENHPDFELPFILLKKFQPDIFRSFLWQRGEEIVAKNNELFNAYFGKNIEKPAKSNEIKLEENEIFSGNHHLLEEFLLNPENKYNLWNQTLKNFRFADRSKVFNKIKKVEQKPKAASNGTGLLFDFD
jgi:hypothetical protein